MNTKNIWKDVWEKERAKGNLKDIIVISEVRDWTYTNPKNRERINKAMKEALKESRGEYMADGDGICIGKNIAGSSCNYRGRFIIRFVGLEAHYCKRHYRKHAEEAIKINGD